MAEMDKGPDSAPKPTDKKVQILEATMRVLRDRGLQSLSFETVSAEAALSRQLVRYYYSSLDTLMCDLSDHLGSRYEETLTKGIAKSGRVERLDFFLDFFFGMSDDHPMPDNLEVYDAFFAYAVGSNDLRKRLHFKYSMLGQVIGHELAIAHPQLGPEARDELSFLFVSMMHAHWSYVATLRYSTRHNLTARRAFARLIDSYVREASHHSGS